MPDLIAEAMVLLGQTLVDNASEIVTYVRGEESVEVSAVPGRKLLKISDGFGGMKLEWTDMDFIVRCSELSFDGGATIVVPRRGDFVYRTMPYDVQQFEVLPFGDDPPWVYTDPYQTSYRIHTKQIDLQQFYP